jgi:purine nucleoside phosphorylase
MGVTLFGMSTAPEAVKARSIGFNNEPGGRHFASFSLVTNVAQLEADQKINHGDVSNTGRSNEGRFNPFMHELIVRRSTQRSA